MMEMADYWLLEKDLIPKLFQVIVPRYADKIGPYTLIHKLPVKYPGKGTKSIMMELKNNALPPVAMCSSQQDYTNSLTNVLINSMRNDYRK